MCLSHLWSSDLFICSGWCHVEWLTRACGVSDRCALCVRHGVFNVMSCRVSDTSMWRVRHVRVMYPTLRHPTWEACPCYLAAHHHEGCLVAMLHHFYHSSIVVAMITAFAICVATTTTTLSLCLQPSIYRCYIIVVFQLAEALTFCMFISNIIVYMITLSIFMLEDC